VLSTTLAVSRESYGGKLDFLNFAVFDLLASGRRQLIIEDFSGGAHCCWEQEIYDLAAEPKLIYQNEDGLRGGLEIGSQSSQERKSRRRGRLDDSL